MDTGTIQIEIQTLKFVFIRNKRDLFATTKISYPANSFIAQIQLRIRYEREIARDEEKTSKLLAIYPFSGIQQDTKPAQINTYIILNYEYITS